MEGTEHSGWHRRQLCHLCQLYISEEFSYIREFSTDHLQLFYLCPVGGAWLPYRIWPYDQRVSRLDLPPTPLCQVTLGCSLKSSHYKPTGSPSSIPQQSSDDFSHLHFPLFLPHPTLFQRGYEWAPGSAYIQQRAGSRPQTGTLWMYVSYMPPKSELNVRIGTPLKLTTDYLGNCFTGSRDFLKVFSNYSENH